MTLENIYDNPLVLTDVYNISHNYLKHSQDWEVSHIYNRSRPMILFGFNEIVTHLLNTKIQESMVMEAEEYAKKMGIQGFPVDMWMKLIDELHGWIPLKVEALPDGTWVPKGTPFAQITNTEEGFGELVTWWEGVYLQSSFASGCATEAFHLKNYLLSTSTPTNRFHSFGFRGHRSMEDAYFASQAWNMFFEGTDDFHSVYHAPSSDMSSIPATAHKTVQQFDDEVEAMKHAIRESSKRTHEAVSLVIDTYDAWHFIENYLIELIDYASSFNIIPVFRPDSGDVKEQALAIYRKAKKHCDPHPTFCAVIIGEGMNTEKVKEYDAFFKKNGAPLDFFNYGIGGGYFNHIDRDFLGFSMKTSYSAGKDRMKLTVSNPFKRSIPGYVNIVRRDDDNLMVDYTKNGLYEIIYEMDERSTRPKFKKYDWTEIARRANSQDSFQKEIILSESIKTNIKTFEEKYLYEKMPKV